jgi:energy-coupling factor transport system substrate-specific component
MQQRQISLAIYGLSSAIGVLAFLAPFFSSIFGPVVQQENQQLAGAATAPFLLTALVLLCFVALLFEVQSSMIGAKPIALLGILVAINATLRFAEVAVPGPGGFTPIFMLIILAGYVYGSSFGFLLGAMTLFVSAILTGGVGPWLPYQMFAAGWVGLSTGLIRRLPPLPARAELVLLAVFGACWGFAYGAIMNLWFWPYSIGPADQYWAPGVGPAETWQRYLTFYLLTSFAWDSLAALGNVILIGLFGQPILRALRRFRDRLTYQYQPAAEWSDA